MKIIIGGNHQLAFDVFDWLLNQKENIKLVIAENLDSAWELNFAKKGKELAEKHNIPFLSGDINSFSKEINLEKPDLIVLCRCRQKIKSHILKIPTIGCTNIHYGLLPRYGGIGPIHWAIRNGEKEIGVTLQFMSEEFDEGDIIAQESFSTQGQIRNLQLPDKIIKINGITSWEAYKKANMLGLEIFKKNYFKIKEGNFVRIKQDLSKKLYFTKNSLDYQKDRIIDLKDKSDEQISNLVRAFTFPPCQIPATYNYNKYLELKLES